MVALNLPGQLYPAAETTRLAGQPINVDISVRNIGLRRTSLAERISRTRTLALQLSLSMVLVLVLHDLEPFKLDSKPHMLMQMKVVPERIRIQGKGQEVSSPGSRSVCSLPGIGQPHSFQLAGRITCSALNDSNFSYNAGNVFEINGIYAMASRNSLLYLHLFHSPTGNIFHNPSNPTKEEYIHHSIYSSFTSVTKASSCRNSRLSTLPVLLRHRCPQIIFSYTRARTPYYPD